MKKLFRFRPRDGYLFLTSYIGDDEVVVIPDTNYSGEPVTGISRECFLKCDRKTRYNIKEIVIPDTVKLIERKAFSDLINLEKITLPYQLRYINQYAFRYCKNLTEITFHPNLESINSSAFSSCLSLRKITCLADKVNVAKYAFEGCKSLEEVSYNFIGGLDFYVQLKITINKLLNYNTFSTNEQKEFSAFINKKPKLKNVIFLSDELELITILLDKIIKLKLPALNKCIDYHIKHENTSVTAFLLEYKKNNFTKEKLDNYEENIELVELGFEFPTLEQLKKKWMVDKHENELVITAYKGENTYEEIPVQTIGGKQILYIGCGGEFAKYNYYKLESLTLPEGLKEILESAFSHSRLENISLPQSLTRIHQDAFGCCFYLKEIILPDNLDIIEDGALADCCSLIEIVVPKNVKVISKSAFAGCTNLEKIVLPQGLEIIKTNAFYNCGNIKEIVVFEPEKIKIECEFFKAELEKRNLL